MPAFFNRVLAAGYATTYALKYNAKWVADEEDCTNFISQALYFAGWPMTAGQGNDDATAWYNTGDNDSWFKRSSFHRSRSWGAAENFRQFLKSSGRARLCAITELAIGDVVQHVSNGRTSHTMMITGIVPSSATVPATAGMNGKVVLASYHSRDRLNYPLILLRAPYVNLFWKIADTVPDTDSYSDTMLEGKMDRNWSHSNRKSLFDSHFGS